jgi:hypothetical protein
MSDVYNELQCGVVIEPSPSPTVTPTMTVTPSATFACECIEYELFADGEAGSASAEFINCNGVQQNILVPFGDSAVFCACSGTVNSLNGTLVNNGPCFNVTQTPTATPSSTLPPSPTPTLTRTSTPTITPSATLCECYNYTITNSDEESQGSYEAILCSAGCESEPIVYLIEPNSSVEICACTGSVVAVSGTLVITQGSCCTAPSPSPQSTSTPTSTPTLSPTPPVTETPTPTPTPPVTSTPTETPPVTSTPTPTTSGVVYEYITASDCCGVLPDITVALVTGTTYNQDDGIEFNGSCYVFTGPGSAPEDITSPTIYPDICSSDLCPTCA